MTDINEIRLTSTLNDLLEEISNLGTPELCIEHFKRCFLKVNAKNCNPGRLFIMKKVSKKYIERWECNITQDYVEARIKEFYEDWRRDNGNQIYPSWQDIDEYYDWGVKESLLLGFSICRMCFLLCFLIYDTIN